MKGSQSAFAPIAKNILNRKDFDNYTIGTCLLAGVVGGERFLKSSLLKDSNLVLKQVSL